LGETPQAVVIAESMNRFCGYKFKNLAIGTSYKLKYMVRKILGSAAAEPVLAFHYCLQWLAQERATSHERPKLGTAQPFGASESEEIFEPGYGSEF